MLKAIRKVTITREVRSDEVLIVAKRTEIEALEAALGRKIGEQL